MWSDLVRDRLPARGYLRIERPEGGSVFVLPVVLEGGTVTYPDGARSASVYVLPIYVAVDQAGVPLGMALGGQG